MSPSTGDPRTKPVERDRPPGERLDTGEGQVIAPRGRKRERVAGPVFM